MGEAGLCVLAPAEVGGIAELTEACDWWSFGAILYELLTGMVSSWQGVEPWWLPLSVGWKGLVYLSVWAEAAWFFKTWSLGWVSCQATSHGPLKIQKSFPVSHRHT